MRHSVMREVIVVERETVIENGRKVLCERKIRGLLSDTGEFRLLSFCGRRFSTPQRERRNHAKSA